MKMTGHYTPPPRQEVIYGKDASAVVAAQCERRGVARAVLVTNTSLAGPDGLAATVRSALGAKCAAEITGVGAHSPRADVIRIADALSAADADIVIGLGGGSVCDATKAACLAHANGVDDIDGIDRLIAPAPVKPATMPFLSIPTTLSAGEYTAYAGVTDQRVQRKQAIFHDSAAPDVVVLDAAMTAVTPARLFFSTGMRAVDHAVETWCSVNRNPLVEAAALHALSILPAALLRVKSDPTDANARLDCLIGAWLSVQGVSSGVDLGGSHAIGHMLGGTANMPHGETSCVMLPHVLRYNAAVNADRQAALARAMGNETQPLADQIEQLVAALELPGRLRDAGVAQALLPRIAEETLGDMWYPTNPREFGGSAAILSLLEAAW